MAFFAVMLIPDSQRVLYGDNLIGGLAMFLAGPKAARLAFHAFVVAVDADPRRRREHGHRSGPNGVLNRARRRRRACQIGFAPRTPGTAPPPVILNLIAILQIVTILLSRGNVS